MKLFKTIKIGVFLVPFFFWSCDKDFLERVPTDVMTKDQVFSSVNGLNSLKTGLYAYLGGKGSTMYQTYMPLMGGFLGNDMVYGERWYAIFGQEYAYKVDKFSSGPGVYWRVTYEVTEITNTITNNEAKVLKILGDKDGNSYVAEAKAIRGMVMYDMSRFFGKAYHVDKGASKSMPYITTIQKASDLPKRNTMKEIYEFAIKDLIEAIPHLKDANSVANKKLMNKNAAHAVLSRIYLDMHEYAKAKEHAEKSLKSITLMSRTNYRLGLNKLNNESILGFVLHKQNFKLFRYRSFNSFHDPLDGMGDDFMVNTSLYDIIGDNDVRKEFFIRQRAYYLYNRPLAWKKKNLDNHPAIPIKGAVGYYHYGKFPRKDLTFGDRTKPGTLGLGDYNYIRGSEMVLTLAECQARLGEDTKAQANLDKVRKRSIPTAPTSTNTGQALVDEILLERRKELFAEGHGYRDVLRLGKGLTRDGSHPAKVNLPAGDPKFQWPVPDRELIINPNLAD